MYHIWQISRSDTTGKMPCSCPPKCWTYFVIGFDWLIQYYKINYIISTNQNSGNSRHVIKMPSSIAFVYRSFTRCTLTQKRTVNEPWPKFFGHQRALVSSDKKMHIAHCWLHSKWKKCDKKSGPGMTWYDLSRRIFFLRHTFLKN